MISAEPEEEESSSRNAERRTSASPGFMDWRYQSEFSTYSWCMFRISKMTPPTPQAEVESSLMGKSILVSLSLQSSEIEEDSLFEKKQKKDVKLGDMGKPHQHVNPVLSAGIPKMATW